MSVQNMIDAPAVQMPDADSWAVAKVQGSAFLAVTLDYWTHSSFHASRDAYPATSGRRFDVVLVAVLVPPSLHYLCGPMANAMMATRVQNLPLLWDSLATATVMFDRMIPRVEVSMIAHLAWTLTISSFYFSGAAESVVVTRVQNSVPMQIVAMLPQGALPISPFL